MAVVNNVPGVNGPLLQVSVVDQVTGAGSNVLPAGANRSGAIATASVAQTLASANTLRSKLTGQNISTGDLWINEIGAAAAIDTAGSYRVAAGGTFAINTNRAISIIGATVGQKFTATEV